MLNSVLYIISTGASTSNSLLITIYGIQMTTYSYPCSNPLFILTWHLMLAAYLTTNNPPEPLLMDPITEKIGALAWISFFLRKIDTCHFHRIHQKYQSLSETHIPAYTLNVFPCSTALGAKTRSLTSLFLVGKMVNK